MFKKNTRLTIAMIGIIVFIIPIIFLNYTLDSLYKFSENSVKESMQETLLEAAHKTQKNLEPINYLQNEFVKFHRQLFPNLPDEILNVRLDENYANSLYGKDIFDKIASLTITKYAPIAISVVNTSNNQHYDYISPDLEKQIQYLGSDIQTFIISKTISEIHFIAKLTSRIYSKIGNNAAPKSLEEKYNFNYKDFEAICYKFLSKYSHYSSAINKSLYTDYFGKQLLFPILKYTASSQGVHGYYSIIIPQNSIDPEEIIKSVLASDTNKIKIEITEKTHDSNISNIEEKENGFQYLLDFPTNVKNQIKSYKELQNIDKTSLLNKQLILSINYPDDLIFHKRFNFIIKIISAILLLLYIIISYRFIKSTQGLKISLTYKLVLVLSAIIVIPIMGTIILTLIPSQNISEVVNYQVSNEIHNKISNLNLLNEENNYREISYLYEIKNRISGKPVVTFDINSRWPIFKKQVPNWFSLVTEIRYISPEGVPYRITDCGTIDQKDKDSSTFHLKYTNNLGLVTNQGHENKNSSTLALAFLEKYITAEKEEIAAGQESVITSDVLSLIPLNKSAYIYCKDINNNPYYLYYKRSDSNQKPFRFIDKFVGKNPLWCHINSRFANIELGITLHNRHNKIGSQWPLKCDASTKTNDLLYKTVISLKDSGKTTIKTTDTYDTISEWHYKTDDPFTVTGIAEVSHKTIYSFYIFIIIPILIAYTILLLMIVTGFISIFIKEPMDIYKEAITSLEENKYGTTIKSFSSDEFNNITTAFNEMSEALKQKEQIKRYVSDRLIKSVEDNDVQKAGAGKTERVTILSSDIRNFTGISENHTPAEIVEMLNSYFTLMQQAITKQGGIIDKYIGDAIQAVFYEDTEKEHPVFRACKAALDMRKALASLNTERRNSGLFTIENGIGIDTDFAITGTIGTISGRKDFSVNGEVIERAAGIEAKTKATNSKILISITSEKEISDLLITKAFDDETMELFDVKE